MGVFTLIAGWFKSPRQFEPIETVTLSEQGYRFEHEELRRLMSRLARFETVQFTDAYGAPLTPESISKRWGPDGGIDCVIRIVAPTQQGARNVATRIRNIVLQGDY